MKNKPPKKQRRRSKHKKRDIIEVITAIASAITALYALSQELKEHIEAWKQHDKKHENKNQKIGTPEDSGQERD